MKVMLFPGTFDPFTRGHRDIARRAAKICDELYVAVMENSAKTPLFSLDEREELIKKSLAGEGLDNIKVMKWDGLMVDLYTKLDCCAVVRGIRSGGLDQSLTSVMKLRWLLRTDSFTRDMTRCFCPAGMTSRSYLRP